MTDKPFRFGLYDPGSPKRGEWIEKARKAACLDILSEGRFELGLGTGWYSKDYSAAGIALESPGVRISRMEETVKILNKAFSGESFSFQGRFYKVDEFKLSGLPVQRPRPPLMLGGGGKRMLSFAAQEADIVSLLCIHFMSIKPTESREEQEMVAAEIQRNWGLPDSVMNPKDIIASPHFLIGSEDEMVEKMLHLRSLFGFTYFVFFEHNETCARLIKRLK